MNVAWTRAAEGFPRRAFTVADVQRMIEAGILGEEERFELIKGEIVPMSPSHDLHERLKSALILAVTRWLPDTCGLASKAASICRRRPSSNRTCAFSARS
jgi:Uma2 family endonuclease